MHRIYRYILTTILLIVWVFPLQGGQTRVEAWLDTTAMRMGEQTLFHITATVPKGQKLHWPQIADSLGQHILILGKEANDTLIINDSLWQLTRSWRITAFDSGYHVVPPMPFFIEQQSFQSEPLLLEVQTIKVDTTQPIKPLRQIWQVPLTFREILPWLLLTVVLLVAAIAIYRWWYLRKRKAKHSPMPPAKPALPPHTEALNRLRQLEEAKLWQKGQTKQYYTQLTAIIRHYIERAFSVDSEELTTRQTLEQIEEHIDKQAMEQLKSLLELADMVKFARLKPTQNHNMQSANRAQSFIMRTKPQSNDQLE